MLSARPPPNTADTGGVPMGLHGSKQQSAEDDKADHVSGAADESPRKPQTGTGAHEAGTDVAVSTSTPPLAPVTTPQKAPAPENASPVKDAGGDTPVPFMLDVREVSHKAEGLKLENAMTFYYFCIFFCLSTM